MSLNFIDQSMASFKIEKKRKNIFNNFFIRPITIYVTNIQMLQNIFAKVAEFFEKLLYWQKNWTKSYQLL